jgi:Transglycosylase SLT domain
LLCVPSTLAAADENSLAASVCRIIDSSALAQHLPVAFLTQLIWQESNFRPDAVSPVGARGIAQFMPGTAAERGLANPDDPEAAIPKAAELLASLRQRFGNLGLAAAAYNAGATRVASWLAGAGQLPSETRDYVMIVTRHPLEDWRGVSSVGLTDDAVFPDSSCIQQIAAVSHGQVALFASPSSWTGFSKGAAMWNAYLSSLPIEKLYATYISSELRLDFLVGAAVLYLVLAYVRRPIKNIRDELRRNKIELEAVFRRNTVDSAEPLLSKPVPAPGGGGLLRAERGERLFETVEPRTWRPLLTRFGRRGLAAPQGPASAPGPIERQDAAFSQATTPAASEPAAPEPDPMAFDAPAQKERTTSPPEAIPLVQAAYRQPLPEVGKAKTRRFKPLLIGAGLASSAICGALAIYVGPPDSTFGARAAADLASSADVLKTYWGAMTGSSTRDEERSAIRDVTASLAQVTVRLNKIEREDQAHLDELRAHIDQESSSRFADLATRLDKLEQKVAAPAAPAPEFADVVARLDKLERKAALPATPAPQIADIAARLDKLEKKPVVAGAPSPEGAGSGPRLDTGEKRAAISAASTVKPLAPAAQKLPTLVARAEPSALSGSVRPDSAKPLLRDYSVQDVRNGIALIDSRYGTRQVAPGDIIPGAGRVLSIDRQGGSWFVLTSLGIILGGPAP